MLCRMHSRGVLKEKVWVLNLPAQLKFSKPGPLGAALELCAQTEHEETGTRAPEVNSRQMGPQETLPLPSVSGMGHLWPLRNQSRGG